MEKSSLAVSLVLLATMVGLLSLPMHVGQSFGPTATAPGRALGSTHVVLPSVLTPAAPGPRTTFPRTVLVESFTGVWCIHCPAESQALYKIDHTTSHDVLIISELHICGGTAPNCYDNYVPPDGTTNSRGAFYGVCGYPDVFFDGGHDACGATDLEAQMQYDYEQHIANASSVPGNVSIAQSAEVTSTGVIDHASVTSGVTGSYNAVTYLQEYIGKRNVTSGYGPHDIGYVVRSTLFNHPLNLVDGATTQFNATGALNSSWNTLNLSVVTLVQKNTTKAIQNANFAPVVTLAATVQASHSPVVAGDNSTITVQVVSTKTGAAVPGAAVSLTSSAGAVFTPANGVTAADGSFSATYTGPNVSSPITDTVTAQVTAAGYTYATGTTTLVDNPIGLSILPTGFTLRPGVQQVALNWTTPAAGGVGVSYDVYRSTSATGVFASIGVTYPTKFVDTGLAPGQTYWYRINAHNPTGFSRNTSALSATGVTVVPQGLPVNVGWWLSVDSANFSSPTNTSMPLYLPTGTFNYEFGPNSYGYLASPVTVPITVAGTPFSVTAVFSLRYATLQGTVSPMDATVTVNGAAVLVTKGAFSQIEAAGTYTLNVSSPGYHTNSTTVTLTPGNTTTKDVQLAPAQSGTGPVTSSNSGLTTDEQFIIGAAVVGLAAVLGAILVMSRRGKPPA